MKVENLKAKAIIVAILMIAIQAGLVNAIEIGGHMYAPYILIMGGFIQILLMLGVLYVNKNTNKLAKWLWFVGSILILPIAVYNIYRTYKAETI